jgi:hypothetical protein
LLLKEEICGGTQKYFGVAQAKNTVLEVRIRKVNLE